MMENDPLAGFPADREQPFAAVMARYIALWIMVAALVFGLVLLTMTSGCVTAAKQAAFPPPTPTPTPIPTPEPTPIPTPTPPPPPDYSNCNAAQNCYGLKEWHHMYIPEVVGRGIDLVLHATVYDWVIIDGPYHYHSVTQGTRAFEEHWPYPGFKFLIIMVNVYSDTDAQPYGIPRRDWYVQVKDRVYSYDWDYDPTKWIWELRDRSSYNKETSVQPYGYRIVQERITGIITAQELGQIYKGRSNAWDGYIIYEIPLEATIDDIKFGGNFQNIGGYGWWLPRYNLNAMQ